FRRSYFWLGPGYCVQVEPLRSSENARTLPESKKALSVTCRIHVPAPCWPANAPSGCAGWNDPVNGAWEARAVWIELAALSRKTAWKSLWPDQPGRLSNMMVRPLGELSVAVRSLTKE